MDGSLESLCDERGARSGYRLQLTSVPAEPPFPGSADEARWLGRREQLVVTVFGTDTGGRASAVWRRGESEERHDRQFGVDELGRWTDAVDACGAWTLSAFPPLVTDDDSVTAVHETYVYRDDDPDSLDLGAWSEPRRNRIEGSRADATDAPQLLRLMQLYGRFLSATIRAGSRLAALLEQR